MKIKEGFKGSRQLQLSEATLGKYADDAFIGNLYVRKMGIFPAVKYHYIQKDNTCPYNILLYCTNGEGWYTIGETTYRLRENQYAILPKNTAYTFGANNSNPWTIYWIHFRGRHDNVFCSNDYAPRDIKPNDVSRINERLTLFEELYHSFSLAYIPSYMLYTSCLLGHLLASFTLLEQYRSFVHKGAEEQTFATKVTHYMEENINKNITLQQLADHFHYSPTHFSTLFRRASGTSPIDHFLHLKMQKACQYMELTEMKLNEIAICLGIEDAAYFSKLFSKIMGISPSAYRQQESTSLKF